MNNDFILKVDGLTKTYANFNAVDNLSFSVKAGDIVGFLGPNGAGKSTTMRMLTGFIKPSSGTANIGGFDICKDCRQVQKIVGYLPESSPLYLEMTPLTFLHYRAKLRGFNKQQRDKRITELFELIGITDHAKVPISQLSKGYRQRVALADAILHRPKLVILDEPTSGLDPAQITDFRNLIRNLVPETSVLLSTHILQEVEAICTKVVIIKDGRLLVSSTPQNLLKNSALSEPIVVECQNINNQTIDALKQINGIKSVTVDTVQEWFYLAIYTTADDIRTRIFQIITENGGIIRELHRKELTLENIVISTLEGGHK